MIFSTKTNEYIFLHLTDGCINSEIQNTVCSLEALNFSIIPPKMPVDNVFSCKLQTVDPNSMREKYECLELNIANTCSQNAHIHTREITIY